jgi:hypothetical protein
MIRYVLIFAVLTALIYVGIHGWRLLSNLDKWTVIKTLTLSVLCATIAFAVLTTIVVLF